jgi:NADH-quinone oxidoreductase subunit M
MSVKLIGLISTSLVFLISIFICSSFLTNFCGFQEIAAYQVNVGILNFNVILGLDSISILFFVLTTFLIFLCMLFIWDEERLKEYVLILLILDFLLIIVFLVLDVFLFYIFFESILIPMYLMIGVWGSRERKVRAVYLFFFFTLIGSLCMLLSLLYIHFTVGTLSYEYLYFLNFNLNEQFWLWLAFFLAFASKIPLFPFHIWLPEAHVEAPTVGSVILAGVLLKLGVYGFLRFNINIFSLASIFFAPIVHVLSIFGIIYTSLSALRQTDLKRIIAYSSVAHMNLICLGIFSFNIWGVQGCIFQSISHGFVAGALFFLIGILYKKYHSRILHYYGGLVYLMPFYSGFFLFFIMSNISLPGTSSFIGEFILLLGIFKINILSGILALTGVVLCGSYSLWMYNRIFFGNIKQKKILFHSDINFLEFLILISLCLLVIFFGLFPGFLLNFLHIESSNYAMIINN